MLHLYIRQMYDDAGVKLEKKDIGMWSGSIKNRILRNENESAADIRKGLDEMMSNIKPPAVEPEGTGGKTEKPKVETKESSQPPTDEEIEARARDMIDDFVDFPANMRLRKLADMLQDIERFRTFKEDDLEVIGQYYPGYDSESFRKLHKLISAEL